MENINELIKQTLKENLIILGGTKYELKNAVIIPSTIPSEKLSIKLNDTGVYELPTWLQELENSKSKLLIINSIDKIDINAQKKFYEILKYKRTSSYPLPENTKIIITSQSKDQTKINIEIRLLCLII